MPPPFMTPLWNSISSSGIDVIPTFFLTVSSSESRSLFNVTVCYEMNRVYSSSFLSMPTLFSSWICYSFQIFLKSMIH